MNAKAWDADGYDAHFGFVTDLGAPLLELLEPQPGETIIDVGCGTGHHARALGEMGVRVLGIDADAAMIERAQRASGDAAGVTFVRADAQVRRDLEHPEILRICPADAVLSNAALHWMTRADAVIANVRALLRPGGRFVAELGAARNVESACAAIESALIDLGVPTRDIAPRLGGQWWFPTPATEAVILEKSGFAVTSMQYFDRPTQLDEGDTVATWSRMFAAAARDLVPQSRASELDELIDEHATRLGLSDGGWHIDYVRLRFTARAT